MTTETEFAEPTEREKLAFEITNGLAYHTSSECLYKHWLPIRYTEGVKYLAEKAGAYWLIDAVASYQPGKKVRRNQRLQEFQVWTLKVDLEKSTAVLTCREDSGPEDRPVITQRIPYSDFPLAEIELWVENGVLLLPSEH